MTKKLIYLELAVLLFLFPIQAGSLRLAPGFGGQAGFGGGAPSTVSWTLVQSTNSAASSGTSPFTTAFTSNSTAGNAIVCAGMATASGGGVTLAIADTPNGAYSLLTYLNPNNSLQQNGYVLNGVGGSIAPKMTVSGSTSHNYMACAEIHRSTGTAALGAVAGYTATSTNMPVGNSITTTGANSAIFSAETNFNANTAVCNSPWLQIGKNSDQGSFNGAYVLCYQLNVTPGTYAGAFTQDSTDADWVIQTWELK